MSPISFNLSYKHRLYLGSYMKGRCQWRDGRHWPHFLPIAGHVPLRGRTWVYPCGRIGLPHMKLEKKQERSHGLHDSFCCCGECYFA